MTTKPFHLGWFLQGSSVQAWGEPWTGHIGRNWMMPELFIDMARCLERACFDYLLIEDSSYVGESYGGSTEIYLANGIAVPRQDPSVVASLMSQVTSRIGIVPTFGTYAYPPYLLARLVASLDQVSSGRIGWNAVTGSSHFAAMNFGLPGMPEHDLRYDMADEYMQAVKALWGSWEPRAIIADRHSGILVDPTKVHAVNHEGRFFKPRGPLNSGPAPQGQPVIAQAGGSPRGRQFAAQYADTIVASTKGTAAMKAYRDDVRARMAGWGRDPDSCKVLFLVAPIIGETEEEATAPGAGGGAGAAAPRASWQGNEHRFWPVRYRQAAAGRRHHQWPPADAGRVPPQIRRQIAARGDAGAQHDGAFRRTHRHAGFACRAHGRSDGRGWRRWVPVLAAQRQPAHAGRDRGWAGAGLAGSRPGAHRVYTPDVSRQSARILNGGRNDQTRSRSSALLGPGCVGHRRHVGHWRQACRRTNGTGEHAGNHFDPGEAEGRGRGAHCGLWRHRAGRRTHGLFQAVREAERHQDVRLCRRRHQ